ncbi:hypothetical protein FA13DRAFT_333298 [Coprinellus micaceus]|uniref:Uncharacterized protein n=1 Tax=Coprinellus micaceus TaxID=71717 RepID=A0A4Y7TBM4_COPMI|nr:hypothetical protein FA13DRAFT_333298 [Coprinellus micaceus]
MSSFLVPIQSPSVCKAPQQMDPFSTVPAFIKSDPSCIEAPTTTTTSTSPNAQYRRTLPTRPPPPPPAPMLYNRRTAFSPKPARRFSTPASSSIRPLRPSQCGCDLLFCGIFPSLKIALTSPATISSFELCVQPPVSNEPAHIHVLAGVDTIHGKEGSIPGVPSAALRFPQHTPPSAVLVTHRHVNQRHPPPMALTDTSPPNESARRPRRECAYPQKARARSDVPDTQVSQRPLSSLARPDVEPRPRGCTKDTPGRGSSSRRPRRSITPYD